MPVLSDAEEGPTTNAVSVSSSAAGLERRLRSDAVIDFAPTAQSFAGADDLFDAEIDSDSGQENRSPAARGPFSDDEDEDVPLAAGRKKSSQSKYAKKKQPKERAPRPRKQRVNSTVYRKHFVHAPLRVPTEDKRL